MHHGCFTPVLMSQDDMRAAMKTSRSQSFSFLLNYFHYSIDTAEERLPNLQGAKILIAVCVNLEATNNGLSLLILAQFGAVTSMSVHVPQANQFANVELQ